MRSQIRAEKRFLSKLQGYARFYELWCTKLRSNKVNDTFCSSEHLFAYLMWSQWPGQSSSLHSLCQAICCSTVHVTLMDAAFSLQLDSTWAKKVTIPLKNEWEDFMYCCRLSNQSLNVIKRLNCKEDNVSRLQYCIFQKQLNIRCPLHTARIALKVLRKIKRL